MKTTGYIHDGWFVLRLNRSLNLDYFYYLLASDFVRSQFNRLASGAIVLNINSDLVKQAVLPIPPIEEQDLIAKRIEQFSTLTKSMEEEIVAAPSIYRPTLEQLKAQAAINFEFNPKQQAFLHFVLAQYVSVGVEELDLES